MIGGTFCVWKVQMANDIDLPPPPEPRPVIRHNRPRSTGATVVVACKHPQGVILRMFEKETYQEPTQTGSRDTERYRPIPDKTWVIRGTYVASAGQAYNRKNSAVAELLPGGYALTHGVPKEIWDNWLHYNRNTRMVRNHVIFAMPSMTAAAAEAKKLRAVKSGLEPLDPDKPAERMPGGVDRRLRMNVLIQDEGTSSR